MRWDPDPGQLGWREIWVDVQPHSIYRVNAELFVVNKIRRSGAGLSCSILLEYREGYTGAEPSTLGSGFIDCVPFTEERITSTRTIKRRPASNDDINWLFEMYNEKTNICYGKWLSLVRKEFVEQDLVSLCEYKRLQTLIEPFLPTHPRNRYQD